MTDQLGGRSQPSEEQVQIVRSLSTELEQTFLEYLRGDIGFAEVTFEVFDTLQAVHAVATGQYSVEYEEEDESDIEVT
jgi:hypothetical protein